MIRGIRAEADDRPGRGRKKTLPPCAEILGLTDWPFRESRHAWLLNQSAPVQEALEDLRRRLTGEDGAVLLAIPAVPGLQDALGEGLGAGLADEFLAAALRADLLMTPEELLQQVVEALSLPAETGATPESLMDGLGELLAEYGGVLRGLVLQVEDAHELSADALDVLIELARLRFENADFSVRVLLWGGHDLRERLEYALADHGLEGGHVEIPPFSAADVRAYLEYGLRQAGLRGDFPLSDEQVAAIHAAAGSLPGEVDRLGDAELEKAAAVLAGRSRRYPLGHSLAALALLVVLALLYTSIEDEAAAPIENEAAAPFDGEAAPAQADPGAALPLAAAPAGAPPLPAAPAQAGATAVSDPSAAGEAADSPRPLAGTTPPPNPEAQSAPPPAEAPGQAPAPVAVAPAAEDPAPPAPAAESSAPPRQPSELERQHAAIRAFPSGDVVVQMMGSFSQDSARQFIASYGAGGRFHYLRSEYQGRPWYVVVYGSFAGRGQAEEALGRLPAAARQGEPWIRPARDIVGQIRE